MWQKAAPDPYRVSPLPEPVYYDIGNIETTPCDLLVMGWLAAGVVNTSKKEIETPKGTVPLDIGQTWGSRLSIREDIALSSGGMFTIPQIRYSEKKLQDKGWIEHRELALPQTKGKYGSIYTLSPSILSDYKTYIDVSKGYQIFYLDADPSEFKISELVIAKLDSSNKETAISDEHWRANSELRFKRHIYGDAQSYINETAEKGSEESRFVSVGRWKNKTDAKSANAPVVIPYLTIDIDRGELITAWNDTSSILKRIKNFGFDMDRVYVSFSGRKGFHIQISGDQFGGLVFNGVKAASEMNRRLADHICGPVDRDKSVDSPLSLIRLSGSKHERTTHRKYTWIATDFTTKKPVDLVEDMNHWKGITFPDPYSGESIDEIVELSMGHGRGAGRSLARRSARRGGGKAGSVINALLGGVEENTSWHERHSGRNYAAFILAIWLLEGKKCGDEIIDHVYQMEGIEPAMLVWNKRNTPPLSKRSIKGRIQSAKNKLLC